MTCKMALHAMWPLIKVAGEIFNEWSGKLYSDEINIIQINRNFPDSPQMGIIRL